MAENVRWITAAEAAETYEPIGGGGGSFLSNAIARVDPSGDNSTGTIGDLSKPYLTVQAALDAITPSSDYAVIDLGNNYYDEALTSNLSRLIFRGQSKESSGVNSLTLFGSPSYVIEFINCNINDITSDTSLELHLQNSACNVTITSGGPITIQSLDGVVTATLSCPSQTIVLYDVWATNGYLIINSSGSDVYALNTIISELNAASSISLRDSRIITNNSAATPLYNDVLFTNIVFPDADPHVAGAAYWVAGVLTKSAG